MFLFLAAIPDDLVDGEVGMVAIAESNGTTCSTDLLYSNAVLHIAKTSAAILL